MSNANTSIEGQQATSYVLAIAIFVLSVTIYEILTVKICITLATSYVLAIVIFALAATVYEIFTLLFSPLSLPVHVFHIDVIATVTRFLSPDGARFSPASSRSTVRRRAE